MGPSTVTSSISSLRSMAPTSTPLRKPKIWVTTDTPRGMIIKMIMMLIFMIMMMIKMLKTVQVIFAWHG